jgi:hypothetical protein
VPNIDTDSIIQQMRELARQDTDRKADTDKIAVGTIYHFFEGRKRDKDGHWHGTGFFYWQRVYRDPDTGTRIKRGGKAFESCPDEERKRQYLEDTGRTIEPITGRLQKIQRSSSTLFDRTNASVYEIRE